MARLRLKACKRCYFVVPEDVHKCPRCGGTEFGRVEGLVVVFEPEKSIIAETLNIKEVGIYAQKVRDRFLL